MKPKSCTLCGSPWHNKGFCPTKKHKRLKQFGEHSQSLATWIKEVARPYLITKHGNLCTCCLRPAYDNENLDVDHILNKGSHPHLKRELSNLQLLCRACHQRKTDHLACPHI